MSLIANASLDSALQYIIDNVENLHICNADPLLVWANIATMSLGTKTSPSIGAPAERSGGGREVEVASIADGNVTVSDDATHFALTDDTATTILVSGSLNALVAVTSGRTFTLTAFKVGIPDPA